MEFTTMDENEDHIKYDSGMEDSPKTSSCDNYIPVASLTEGKFSRVYKCQKKESFNKQYVIIKVIPNNDEKRYEKEIMTLQKLRKGNFFPLLIDFFPSGMNNIIVTEYVSGVSLRQLIKIRGHLTDEALMFYMAEMFVAICRLHKVSVHRDISPRHVLLGQDGHVVLSGLGAALPRRHTGLYDGHKDEIRGPPDYRARELILREPYSCAVDWWSYAMTSYYIASGGMHAFFPGPPLIDNCLLIPAVVMSEPQLQSGLCWSLRELLEGLLRRCPQQRIGFGGEHEIACHPFFDRINWIQVDQKGLDPPFYPQDFDLLPEEKPVSEWPHDID